MFKVLQGLGLRVFYKANKRPKSFKAYGWAGIGRLPACPGAALSQLLQATAGTRERVGPFRVWGLGVQVFGFSSWCFC